ncbi:hypothetical protein SAMN04488574_103303 [Bacillus sp. 71mf]|nr:hypothetical protein SAMN04488574_103303 [Bacillus sp. 71mf]SFS45717.1 hypothetical protein SAMN04488145_101599 [Bacillus sp. 103mf]
MEEVEVRTLYIQYENGVNLYGEILRGVRKPK